jgi:hypothetical protein
MVPASASNTVLLEGVVQYISSALFGLLAWWIDGKRRMTIDEVNDLFRRMALPAVKAAIR